MAISPTVQQYQTTDMNPEAQQMQQQQQTPGATDADTIFKQRFGDSAYKVLQSKYPKLVSYVVMFKTIDTNVDQGYGIGSFIIKNGPDVLYIPIVMVGGNIESCEMLYNKTEDTLYPLNDKEIDRIVGVNQTGSFTLNKNVVKDNSAGLFRNMFRPPVSSRPVFAGSTMLENLPDTAKKALADYLIESPETLQKIAEFYPVDLLAEKLAAARGATAVAKASDASKSVFTTKDLTGNKIKTLTDSDKEKMVSSGYYITKSDGKNTVLPAGDMIPSLVTKFDITRIDYKFFQDSEGQDNPVNRYSVASGDMYTIGFDGIMVKPVLVTPNLIFSSDGKGTGVYDHMRGGLVVSNIKSSITGSDLVSFGAIKVKDIISVDKSEIVKHIPGYILVCYKMKNGTYKAEAIDTWGNISVQALDFDVSFFDRPGGDHLLFRCSDKIEYGFLKLQESKVYPLNSTYIMFCKNKPLGGISDLGSFFKLIKSGERFIKVAQDGVGYTLIDSKEDFHKKFRKEAELAEYLVNKYSLTKEAVETTIKEKNVIILEKMGALFPYSQNTVPYGSMIQPGMTPNSSIATDPNLAGMLQGQTPNSQFDINSDIVDSAVNLQDQDVLDTGLIASLAGNKDIKILMLDMLPSFVKTVSDIGKSILLYLINSQNLQKEYGREEYSNFLSSLRSLFSSMGDITTDLKTHLNTH